MQPRALPVDVTCRADVDVLLAAATNYEEKRPRDPLRKALDLGRVRALLAAVGDPQARARCVHVAGSKGKGTVARMVAAGLAGAGRGPVGLYTSPHLEDLAERIAVDGRPASEGALAAAARALLPHLRASQGSPAAPTFFEILTAMAWLVFREARCTDVVLETGLGGRLDATNVCAPAVTVITRIELEHTSLLGDTIDAIAAEKAGIVKPAVPVVTCLEGRARRVVEETARRVGAPLHDARGVEVPADVTLAGAHHRENARAAHAALALLGVEPRTAWRAIAGTRLPGILEVLAKRPRVVIDGAHTVASAAGTRAAVARRWPGEPVVLVLAMLAGKDARGVIRALAEDVEAVVTTSVDSPRALEPEALADVARAVSSCPVESAPDAARALARARVRAAPGGLVLCTGSLYLAGAVRTLLREAAS